MIMLQLKECKIEELQSLITNFISGPLDEYLLLNFINFYCWFINHLIKQ